ASMTAPRCSGPCSRASRRWFPRARAPANRAGRPTGPRAARLLPTASRAAAARPAAAAHREAGEARMLRSIRIALLALLDELALAAPAAAQVFPTLTGRVVDGAGVLSAETRALLTRELADLEAKTTRQLVVVTINSLDGRSIEDYGVRLGRAWQIG